MCAQNEVYIVGLLEGIRLGGADAACEGDPLYPSLPAKTAQFPEVSFYAIHGVLADVAGVQYYEVRVLVALDLGVAGVLDHPSYAVGVVHVHLASERPYAGCPGAGIGPPRRLSGERYGHRRLCRATHTLPPARRPWP